MRFGEDYQLISRNKLSNMFNRIKTDLQIAKCQVLIINHQSTFQGFNEQIAQMATTRYVNRNISFSSMFAQE